MTNEEAKKRIEIELKCMNCDENTLCYGADLVTLCNVYDDSVKLSLKEALKVAVEALNKEKNTMFAFLDGAGQGILKGMEIRKGKWIDTEPNKDRGDKGNNPWQCSCCGHRAGKDKYKTYKFCPWCGADMRE